jgi:cation transport protein ChaC
LIAGNLTRIQIRWIDLQSGPQEIPRIDILGCTPGQGLLYRSITRRTVQRLARAAGHLGTSAEYLHNTIVKLEEFGIHDSYLWQLQKLVADEIKRMRL